MSANSPEVREGTTVEGCETNWLTDGRVCQPYDGLDTLLVISESTRTDGVGRSVIVFGTLASILAKSLLGLSRCLSSVARLEWRNELDVIGLPFCQEGTVARRSVNLIVASPLLRLSRLRSCRLVVSSELTSTSGCSPRHSICLSSNDSMVDLS